VVWICLGGGPHPRIGAGLIKQGYETNHAPSTTMVVFILIGSTCFSVVFQGVSGGAWLEHLPDVLARRRLGLPDLHQPLYFLSGVSFLDFFEIAFIIPADDCGRIAQKGPGRPVVGPEGRR